MGRTWPVGVAVALLAAACSEAPAPSPDDEPVRAAVSPKPSRFGSHVPERVPPEPAETRAPAAVAGESREPRRSFLTVPAIGLRDFPAVRYRGAPDDGTGTRIQDSGPTASPRGPDGGVGAGVIGNLIVTGHRTSHAAPFAELPALRRGDRVRVRTGDTVFVHEITDTRSTSFRSLTSLARQSAPVPGRPGREPTKVMITLSTCATLEDHARGNYWADEHGNPEHRIDKIGVLVAARPGA